ncbi:DNA polymerase III subunit gamma/tau [Ktedonosporobacter rubrisoli]|nr:DNA polymerase III subunit gamma/tau [Ktedonosporobacter rubrisoli]
MASQSLYRKWRSQTFSEMVGQEFVIRTLKNALHSGNLAHAYLFAGPRGTGKTSTARLLAKTINCLNPQDGEPCNECVQCREITAGNSFNVVEIDAASNRGIDSIRELREKVMVPPSAGKYKVYILDEAHMLTTEAFNALLKTLEEPPNHAIFVMATTDVHKMLPTVLSRCQRFDFKRFTLRQIVEHLQFVASQEQVTLESGAPELIARAAAGGMRDALSLLDQAIAYCGQHISLTQVQSMLGVADPRAIQKFIVHIANLNSAEGLHLIHELAEAGADLRQINTQVAEYWRAMMLAKAGADISAILDSTEDEVREIQQTAQLFELLELVECARIFAQNDLMQKNQGTPQLGLELALLASVELHRRGQAGLPPAATPAVAASPAAPAQAQFGRSTPAPQAQFSRSAPAPQPQPRTQPPVNGALQPPSPANTGEEQMPSALFMPIEEAPEEIPKATEAPINVESAPAFPQPVAVQAFVPSVEALPNGQDADSGERPALNPPSLSVEQVKEQWESIKRRIKTKRDGAMIAALLNDYTVVAIEGSAELPIVVLKASSDFHYKTLSQKNERQKIIEWALKLQLGQECRIRLLPPGGGGFDNGRNFTGSGPSAPFLSTAPAGGGAAFTSGPSSQPQNNQPGLPTQGRPANKLDSAPVAAVMDAIATTNHSPLARTSVVRENTSIGSGKIVETVRPEETRQETVKHKATSDPVVQEVVRMFKGEIKEFHLK